MPLIRERKQKLLITLAGFILLLHGLSLVPESVCLLFVKGGSIWYTVAHLTAYFSLAFISCLALRFQRNVGGIRMTDWNVTWFAFALAAIVGALTEGIQVFGAGRMPTWYDYGCNLAGAVVGILMFLGFKRTLDWIFPNLVFSSI